MLQIKVKKCWKVWQKSPKYLINMFLVSDLLTFCFLMMHLLDIWLIYALLSQNFVAKVCIPVYMYIKSAEKACRKTPNLWLTCSWFQIFWNFAIKLCILYFWLIDARLLRNFVVIYSLFLQMFLDWKAESADFYTFTQGQKMSE